MKNKLLRGFASLKIPALILAISICAILFVWQRAYTLSISRQVVKLEYRMRELRSQNSEKEIILSELYSSERIESLAGEICGLHYSKSDDRILVIDKQQYQKTNSHLKQSFFAIKKYFTQKWASITGSNKNLMSEYNSGTL
ncbi:hypothetical protein J7L68_03480 [bacterium]|nr:hypothetical protein [bacterium]